MALSTSSSHWDDYYSDQSFVLAKCLASQEMHPFADF